jgi:hypothetical protein
VGRLEAHAQQPAHDRTDQLEQVQNGLLEGEQLYAVYDAKGGGTGFIGLTDRRVILQDKSFMGRQVALVSIPYGRIYSVAVLSDASIGGKFFSTSTLHITTGGGGHSIEFRGAEMAHYSHDLILSNLLAG